MLREIIHSANDKGYIFQTMLLNNDKNQEVEIQEATKVDFSKVREHLRQGGSVFITSKSNQKLRVPKLTNRREQRKRKTTRTVTALFFEDV